MKEIETLDDIKHLVDTFYAKVRKDELIGPIFAAVVQDRWPMHLGKMYTFWQTVLTEDKTYRGQPFMPHMKLPIQKKHFDRWLALFFETVDANFEGEKADEAKWRAERMAQMFWTKLTFYRSRDSKPLI